MLTLSLALLAFIAFAAVLIVSAAEDWQDEHI